MPSQAHDLTRTVLAIVAIALLIVGSLWVMRPFLGPGIWATMIVVATWPLMRQLQRRFGGHRAPAVAVMVVVLLAVLVVPLYLAVATIIDESDRLITLVRQLPTMKIPPPPEWLLSIPLGPRLSQAWHDLAASDPAELSRRITPYVGGAVRWFGSQVGTVGGMVVHFLVTVILSAILYTKGEVTVAGLQAFFRRLAGARGEESVELGGRAIRAVALGVVVTAVVQSTVAGIGLAIAGIPYAGLLTAVVFMLCIAQIGPILVMVPAVIWLYATGSPGMGTFLLVWGIAVIAMDNILRPWLITRGANLPLLLIFAGVIGGLLGFGIIGLFVGPVVLAVTYTLLTAWVREGAMPPGQAPVPTPAKADARPSV
jgi:predicted PurR-regulated permease PerM